ncbi:acrosomal protein KIAA1210 homolog isoform X2 [Anolis sagrei]|uniref:acrosomal protein KIAA1210 homolog isoform X2 n=1 Tax=Anolis sagrei TaxID=38937 RepID=UPI003521999B
MPWGAFLSAKELGWSSSLKKEGRKERKRERERKKERRRRSNREELEAGRSWSRAAGEGDCIMAAKPMDLTEPLDVEDVGEEFSRKKKSRFQSFKNFFAKKKKARAAPTSLGETKLKPSQSSSDLAATDSEPGLLGLPTEPTSKGSMGSKALSHDSVFICESLPDVADKTASQDDLPGKVKALQLRLQPNLRLGSPPLVIPGKKAEDVGAMSEDDGLPKSPPEISTLHDVLACPTSEVASESASRPLSPVVLGHPALAMGHFVPADFNSPATPLGCLDTSAARHKMAVHPRRQKAFANKTQSLFMEQLEKEECSFGSAEGKSSPPESPEGAESHGKDRKGLSAQNAKIPSWTKNILPATRVADALRYSWNAGPGTDGDWHLGLEMEKEAAVQMDGWNKELPKCEEKEDMEEEEAKRTDGLKHHLAKEVTECAKSLPPEAEAAGPGDLPFLAMPGDVPGRVHDLPTEYIHSSCPQLVEQESEGSRTVSDVKYGEKAGDRTWNGSWSPAPDSAEFVPSPVSETLSEAEEISTFEDVPTVKEGEEESADVETELFGSHTQQEEVAAFVAKIEEPPLQKAARESPFPSSDPCTSPLRNSPGRQEENTIRRSLNHPSFPPEAAEIPSKSIPLDNDSGESSENMKTGEESKNPDEDVETQAKCVSAKPVRFTIAPAWQRSLSGGSSSTDSACLTSSPSSPPIKPELFEGTSQLDSALPGCLFSSPERLERSKSSTNSITEQPHKEPHGQESPFGVRLRRTSSLLKYQMEQQRQERLKQTPSPASSAAATVLAKDEPKVPISETPPPKRTTGSVKGLVAKPEKKSLTVKAEEGTTKQQMSRASDQSPSAPLEPPSPEPAWISMAKLKRSGFQGFPLIEGQKRDQKPLAKAEQAGEKHVGVSPQEKHLNLTGLPLLKNSIPHHVLEMKTQPKMTTSAPKAKPIRAASREVRPMEKETHLLPSLPLSSCGSPSEPPWLSLAKQKAKAWSEMPQIVQ